MWLEAKKGQKSYTKGKDRRMQALTAYKVNFKLTYKSISTIKVDINQYRKNILFFVSSYFVNIIKFSNFLLPQ